MAGNKNSGRHDIPPGPGRLPKKFTLKMGDTILINEVTPDGCTPLRLFTVNWIDRKQIELEDADHNKILISR